MKKIIISKINDVNEEYKCEEKNLEKNDNRENFEKDEKSITIIGTNNRYQIKKLVKDKTIKYKNNYKIQMDEQIIALMNIYENLCNDSFFCKKILSELNKKINNYKNQDIKKNIFNINEFIKLDEIIIKLVNCNLKCNYCNCNLFILYNVVRELKQWTLDRIDNNLGHTKDNTIISCLECNITRRNKNKDNFEFTKKFSLIKEN